MQTTHSKNNPHFLSFMLLLIAAAWGIYLYLRGSVITGPFIFGDELLYFSIARSIFHGENLNIVQYGPAYPAIISPLFYFENINNTYQAIRILNIIIFISAVIPGYLLGKELFKNGWLRMLFPFCLMMTPFSGLVYIVWAEPFYFTLFYWTCFLLCLCIKNPTISKSLSLGILLSLLYYTKAGAGLVVQFSAFFTLIIHSLTMWKSQTKQTKFLTGLIILTCLVADLPLILNYLHLNLSIVGYVTKAELASYITHTGYLPMITKSLFHQFSCFFIGTYGMIGIYIALLAAKWRDLNAIERNIMLFAILSVFGLIALSALAMSTDKVLDYRMVNGRYFSVLLPLIIVLTLHLIFKSTPLKKQNDGLLLIVLLVTTLIAISFSPLFTRSPLAFNSMPEMTPIIFIADHGKVYWRHPVDEPGLLLRFSVPILLGGIALCILLLRKWRHAPILITVMISIGAFFSAMTQVYYMPLIGSTQSSLNNIYIFLQKNHIDISTVVFDTTMKKNESLKFYTPFWMGIGKLFMYQNMYQNIEEINKKLNNITASYFISEAKLASDPLFSSGQYKIYKLSYEKD